MKFFSSDQIGAALAYESLIPELKMGFAGTFEVPERHHHNYVNPLEKSDSTLLLMPAWEAGKDLGVKVVAVSPDNGKYDLPSIHGLYLYFDAHKGQPLAIMDAKSLTRIRTAATSALASTFLARENAKTLAVIGTGALAPELIKAHCIMHPIERVFIWGRNPNKAKEIATSLVLDGVQIFANEDLQTIVNSADIISTATLSIDPLVKGRWISQGQHLDLVGSYRPDMREADDDVVNKSRIFVDSIESAPKESGDLAIPMASGKLKMYDIQGDLFGLCRNAIKGRESEEEITLFKSVGHALEDLVAARLVYNSITE